MKADGEDYLLLKMTRGGLVVKLSVVLFMAWVPFAAFGQKVQVTGYVIDSLTQVPLFPATVFNQNSGVATFTDSTGYYVIPAQPGDQLMYSYLGYYSVTYRVPVALRTITHQVEMISKQEQLKTVTIKGLTPYQADSLERIKTFKHYMDKPDYPLVSDATVGTGFGLSLNLDRFSKGARQKRRFHKMFPQFEKDAFINSRYTPQLVEKLTGLTGDSLALFLYRFKPSYEFTRSGSDLEFWSWIMMQYKLWVSGKQTTDKQ